MPNYLKYKNIFFFVSKFRLDPEFFSAKPDPDPWKKMLDPHPWIFLFSWTYRVSCSVEIGQQFAVDEVFGIVNHQIHDDLWHEVPASLGDNLHVGVYEVPDGLHLPLQLRVHGAQAPVSGLHQTVKRLFRWQGNQTKWRNKLDLWSSRNMNIVAINFISLL